MNGCCCCHRTETSLDSVSSVVSHHSPHFKESLEIVDLTQGHGHQHQRFKERPHDHSAVGVLVDGSVDSVSHLQY